MPLPNFFIVGAAKSGTTALYRYLRQHPDVYLPDVKEPRYFSYTPEDRTRYAGPRAHELIDSVVKDRTEYEALYATADGARAIGDVSPAYLPSPIAAARIREAAPAARIVAVLRDPVDRAWSHYLDNRAHGLEPEPDFGRVLDLQDERRDWWRKWDYIGNGMYAKQLKRYLEAFPAERVRVYLYDDLVDDARGLLGDLLRFLGADPSVQIDTAGHHNASGIPRNERWARLLRSRAVVRVMPTDMNRRLRARNRHKPEMPAAARARLRALYEDDVARLEGLIGRDLSAWR